MAQSKFFEAIHEIELLEGDKTQISRSELKTIFLNLGIIFSKTHNEYISNMVIMGKLIQTNGSKDIFIIPSPQKTGKKQ